MNDSEWADSVDYVACQAAPFFILRWIPLDVVHIDYYNTLC